MGEWTTSPTVKVNGEIPLTIYSSKYTHLRVAVASTPGPLVKGLISFVTETADNNGLPHALEHLTFMGSAKYPYKGVLDLIANQCMASGTNAFTCQDYTAYELTTVGSQGFLKILPVYLDHLLHPTLTDAQFLTEIHHINGEGKDGGVVYSEMQECESEMSNLVEWMRKKLFFPAYSPYSVEVGGRLADLRTTCTMEKIREFHREFYHVNNMFVTVCGSINAMQLLSILSDIEDTSHQLVPHLFVRPFRRPTMVISNNFAQPVLCPSEDEKLGMVEIAWKGPNQNDSSKLEVIRKLEVLGHYLCDTAASPVEQDFVQLEEQLASSVEFSVREQATSEIVIKFYGVPVDQLENIRTRFVKKTLTEFLRTFDPERMKHTITHMIDRKLSKMETDCHNVIFEMMCMYQIYGQEHDLEMRLNHVGFLRKLLDTMKENDWSRLVADYLFCPCTCVFGSPSRSEVSRVAKTERYRIEEQRKKLGTEGLKQCAEKLQKAIHETTDCKPPPELLAGMMIRELENFATFKVETLHASTGQIIDAEKLNLPFPIFIHNAKTHFVQLMLIWDTQHIPFDLRIWLMLYFELVFQSSAIVEDQKLSYKQVASLYTRDLVSYSANIGVLNCFWRYCTLSLKAPPTRYVVMLSWLKTFVKGIIFEGERIKVAAQSLIAEANEAKRDGCEMRDALLQNAVHRKGSNECMFGLIPLEEFHKKVLKSTEKFPSKVVNKLEELRSALTKAPINLHIVCNTNEIMPFLPTTLDWLYQDRKCDSEGSAMCNEFRDIPGNSLVNDGFGRQRVIAVAATESSFLKQSMEFKYQLGSEEELAVELIAQYLSQTEGTLYKAIRGTGLAYGVGIRLDTDEQLLSFRINRSVHIEQSYEQAKKVVFEELVHMNELEFEAAKRSLISEIVEGEDTVIDAAHRALCNKIRGLPPQFWRQYCERIWNASMEKVLESGSDFIRDLFDDSKCCRSIAVPHGKLADIKEYFKGIEVVKSSDLHIKLT